MKQHKAEPSRSESPYSLGQSLTRCKGQPSRAPSPQSQPAVVCIRKRQRAFKPGTSIQQPALCDDRGIAELEAEAKQAQHDYETHLPLMETHRKKGRQLTEDYDENIR